ncbi:mechanosensitive ion channel [Lacticigenium naphthae]|uniref:mechanosensitive ion channel n=1 Tax=Lacticigenium naphthae TaxID=515351 RepID=UPI000409951D|nr:mechanosensitive ion channel [Lacticigenium naphthae]
MDNITDSFSRGVNSFINYLPQLLLGIALIVVAWLVATLVKQAISKGLRAIDFDDRLTGWGVANTKERAQETIDAIAKAFYYLVWVLFLPGIFSAFGLDGVAAPFENMMTTALNYLPNIIAAAVILTIGIFAARFVKNLIYNLAYSMNLDGAVGKLTGSSTTTDADKELKAGKKDSIATVLANIVYVLILVPIITVALETLNIRSISEPIINVLNSLMSAIPNILVAVILIGVGFAIAKFVGDLLTDLLNGTGVNKLSDYINKSGSMNIDFANIIGNIVAILIGLFFFVEAITALNLDVLNTIGTAIIGYLPNVIFALVIISLGLVGGQMLARVITKATGSRFTGELVKYILIAFALFMTLDQLNFATTIVNWAFIIVLGGLAVAFGIAFGVGGRDFAKDQLTKLDAKMEKEKLKNDEPQENPLKK